jgi:HEAT repeat protein
MKKFISLLPLLAGVLTVPLASGASDPREAAPLAILRSDASVQDKARACQQLADFAGPAAVPALAGLLGHEQLGDYARSGLESMADPAAGAALRSALGSLRGRQLAGAINSLGVRREAAAVPDLRRFALDPAGGPTAEAAVTALGLVGDAAAARALQDVLSQGSPAVRLPAAHSALEAADRLRKSGGAVAARALLDAALKAVPAGPSADAARRQLAAR